MLQPYVSMKQTVIHITMKIQVSNLKITMKRRTISIIRIQKFQRNNAKLSVNNNVSYLLTYPIS